MTAIRLMLRGLTLTGLAAMNSFAGAPSAGPLDALWHCRGAGLALQMHWREVSPAEGCDGETCRLSTGPMTEGVLMTELGRRIGVVEVQGNVKAGWTFRDIEGRAWRLLQKGAVLKGSVVSQRRRMEVTCRARPERTTSSAIGNSAK